ncbi:MAG: EAL domain-containing protein, partial [Acholeplasmatales bacterium]|nr:EAL domain-containing protein [Acholeplasmatales bacterium]
MFDNPFDINNDNNEVFSYMAKEQYSTVALFDLEKSLVTVYVNVFDPDTVGNDIPLTDYLLYMAESCRKQNLDLSWFPTLNDMKDPDFTKSITKIISLIKNEDIEFIKCEISPFGYSFDGTVNKVVYTTRNITSDIKEYDALIANINHKNDVEENYVDTKTGLFTMEYLHKILSSISSTDDHIKYSLIKIDIRHYESVFEVFGASASDEFVSFLSKKLLKLIDRKNSILIHEHADSFYVLTEGKKEIIEERMGIVSSLVSEYDIPIRLNMKCGVYHLTEKGLAPDIIINRAKMASDHIVNDESINICFYNESIKDEIIKKNDIKTYFHKAIKQREIELYYQPIYDTFTEKVAVVEALVRWNSPELGFVTPNMFIPVLEESGLIVKLDDYVLDRAFEDIRKAQARSLPVPVSINFSRPKIIQKGFADQLQAKLDRAGLEKSFIKIEVNEKALSASTDEVIRAVNELTAKGFIVAMDDFGSEDSSLNALKEFNVSILKLDMKFFKNFDTNDKAKKIVEYAIKMAHAIGLRVVAEGVETKGQLDFLKKNGCELIQGWYFAKAMPFEMALKKIEEDGAHTIDDVNKAKRNLNRREEFLAKYRIEFSQKLILEFMSCANTKGNNTAINEMLKSICRYYQADRAYVFNIDNQNQTTTNIYEYVIPGSKR